MTNGGLVATIRTHFPDALLAHEDRNGLLTMTLSAAHLVEVCELLRDEPEARYDLLIALTVLDGCAYYELRSVAQRRPLRLCVPVPASADAAQPLTVESVARVWPAANWAEREAHDLCGLEFRGHPDLRPLLARCDHDPVQHLNSPGSRWVIATTRYPTSIDGLFLCTDLGDGQLLEAQPELGHRHVDLHACLTQQPYGHGTLFAARMDGFSAMHADLAYALAVEKLLEAEIPPRAQRLRVVYAELQRMASHLYWLVRTAQRFGDPPSVLPAYAWEAREAILGLFQWLGGNPTTPDAIAVGGLRYDAPSDMGLRLTSLLRELEEWLRDIHLLLHRDSVIAASLEGIGVIDPGTALGLAMTGPCLRATGVPYDVRTACPYAGYPSLQVRVATAQGGDAGARYQVRLAELEVSLDLIRQAWHELPDGPVNALATASPTTDWDLPPIPPGVAYASVEGARGELGVYLFSGGTEHPRHVYVRGPSLANLSALPFVARGIPVGLLPAVLDSLDISLSEAER